MLQTTLLIFSAILIFFLLYNYISSTSDDTVENIPQPQVNEEKIVSKEGFNDFPYSSVQKEETPPLVPNPVNEASTLKSASINKNNKNPKKCVPKESLTSKDLLPKNAANTKWAQVNPAGQGDLSDQNFLNAGYHVGINTQGGSLRNSNMGLRSEPPNPQMKVSPWMQSTISPDLNRLPLEIGSHS
jgi:hypothetical protein